MKTEKRPQCPHCEGYWILSLKKTQQYRCRQCGAEWPAPKITYDLDHGKMVIRE